MEQYILKKKVISNKHANSIYNKSFSKLAKSKEYIDPSEIDSKVKDYYNNIFYSIPKEGNNSHRSLITQGADHLFAGNNLELDNTIDNLISQSGHLNNTLAQLQFPDSAENFVYEDGSFLTAGHNGIHLDAFVNKAWIMQEGKKRKFNNTLLPIYTSVRKLLDLSLDRQQGFYYISIEDLNNIPDGPDINNFEDLNLTGDELNEDYNDNLSTNVLNYWPYYELELYCFGNQVLASGADNIATGGYDSGMFTVNDDPCSVTYLFDTLDYYTGASIITEIIPKGESKIIRFIRQTENISWPSNIDLLYNEYNPFVSNVDYAVQWGSGKKYNGVISATGKIGSKEKIPEDTTTIIDFNSLAPDYTIIVSSGEDLVDINDFGNINPSSLSIITPFGTPKIGGENGLWGFHNQNQLLQESFNDVNFNYYRKNITIPNTFSFNINNYTPGSGFESFANKGYIKGNTEFPNNAFDNYNNGSFTLFPNGKTFNIYGQPIINFEDNYYVICHLIDFTIVEGNVGQFGSGNESIYNTAGDFNSNFYVATSQGIANTDPEAAWGYFDDDYYGYGEGYYQIGTMYDNEGNTINTTYSAFISVDQWEQNSSYLNTLTNISNGIFENITTPLFSPHALTNSANAEDYYILLYNLKDGEFEIKTAIELSSTTINETNNTNPGIVMPQSYGGGDGIDPIFKGRAKKINWSSINNDNLAYTGIHSYGTYGAMAVPPFGDYNDTYINVPNSSINPIDKYLIYNGASLYINGVLKSTTNGYHINNVFN